MRARLVGFSVAVVLSVFWFGCIGDRESLDTTEQLLVNPPANVTATAISSSRIELAWTASAGAQGYYVFRGAGAGPRAYVTTVLGTTYSSASLAPATQYTYTVQAYDATSVSADSNVAAATTFGTPMTLPPPTVTATAVSSSRIEVAWNAVAGAVKYYVFRAQGAGPSLYVTTVFGTSYSAAGLASGTYTFRVQAVDAADVASADSNPATATASTQIAAPTGVTATTISSMRIDVQWNAVPGAVKYYVFQALDAGPSLYVTTVYSTSYTAIVVAQSPGEQGMYTFRVRAVDAADVASADSNPATAWIEIDAPTGVTATAISSSRIDVSWNPVARAIRYAVWRDDVVDGRIFVTTVTSTSYTATGLAASTAYTYTVTSVGEGNISSDFAVPASATTLPDTTPIAPPTNVTASAFSSSRIEVGWTAVAQAVRYYVFQAQGAGPAVYVSTMHATYCGASCTYSATGLAAGTTYSYTIQAVSSSGDVSVSSSPPAIATTPGGPAVPTGVNASSPTPTSIDVSWDRVPDAVHYYLFQGTGTTSPPPPWPPLVYLTTVPAQLGSPSVHYRVQGLALATYYTYTVQAVDSMGRVSPMSSVAVTRTF